MNITSDDPEADVSLCDILSKDIPDTCFARFSSGEALPGTPLHLQVLNHTLSRKLVALRDLHKKVLLSGQGDPLFKLSSPRQIWPVNLY